MQPRYTYIEAKKDLVAGWRGQTGRIREEKEKEQLVDFSRTQVHYLEAEIGGRGGG